MCQLLYHMKSTLKRFKNSKIVSSKRTKGLKDLRLFWSLNTMKINKTIHKIPKERKIVKVTLGNANQILYGQPNKTRPTLKENSILSKGSDENGNIPCTLRELITIQTITPDQKDTHHRTTSDVTCQGSVSEYRILIDAHVEIPVGTRSKNQIFTTNRNLEKNLDKTVVNDRSSNGDTSLPTAEGQTKIVLATSYERKTEKV